MGQILVNAEEVALGQPINWELYRKDGSLAFHKGFSFNSKGMLERLIRNGLYRLETVIEKPDSRAKIEPGLIAGEIEFDCTKVLRSHAFSTVESFSQTVGSVLEQITQGKVQARTQLLKLNMSLAAFANENQDMLLGAIHTYFPSTTSTIQPVYSAFICDLTARILGLSDSERASLRAAAITANVGMYHFQDKVNQQAAALTENQKEAISLHPERGIELLERVGVTDPNWLNAVGQHHEMPGGDGYPCGICVDEISTEAKIVNIADRYLAMISARAYSPKRHPKRVLQEIYQSAEGEVKDILLAFIKTLGVYPPGTRVKLANGELAIVASRSGADSTKCVVASICDAGMGIYHEPIFRDTADSTYAIEGFHVQAIPFRIPVELIW